MRKRNKILILATIFFSCNAAWAQTWLDSAEIRINEIRKGNFGIVIKDKSGNDYTKKASIQLAKHEFAWGTVIPDSTEKQVEWQRALIKKYYNFGVAGNIYKWPWIEKEYNIITYDKQDEMLNWAKQSGLGFRGHALLWGGEKNWQMPQWTLEDTITPTEIYEACKVHIKREVAYWKGQIDEYDVMNEPVHETWLSSKVGDSINWNCFKWAHEADPNAVLYVNDFNILVWNDAPAYKAIIQTMLNNGAPIGGIGLQSHFEGKIDWQDIKKKIDYMATLGIPLRVTEFDIKIDEFGVGEQQMAIDYAKMMRIAFSHPAINGFVFWSLWDSNSWRPGAGLYDENRIPKLAADSVYNLIHKQWTTNLPDTEPADQNKYLFNGFYGDYTVTVDFNGELRQFTVPAHKMHEDSIFVLEYANSIPAIAKMVETRVAKNADGIEIQFDQNIDFASIKNNDFHVYSTSNMSVTTIEEIDSVTAKLIFDEFPTFNPSQFYAIYYNGNTIKAKNSAPLASFGPDKINNKLPKMLSATSDTAGSYIYVKFSEKMNSDIENGNFSITKNSTAISLSNISLDLSDASILQIKSNEKIEPGDNLRISYTTQNEHSEEGYLLQSFGPKYIENMVKEPEPSTSTKAPTTPLLSINPNPADNWLHIKNILDIQVIEFYDANGKLFKTIKPGKNTELTLDASEYPKGLINVTFLGTEKNETIKIIKE